MKKRIVEILYPAATLLIFIFAVWVIFITAKNSSRLDFRVFYGAATAAIRGKPIYTLYGIYTMPFWYFPWVAWMYIPLTFLTFTQAWYIYVIVCCGLLWMILTYYSTAFNVTRQPVDKIFIYSVSLLLCMMLFNFGQTDIIVLALATLVAVSLEQRRYLLAGIILPLALIKPHLLIVFVIACFLKGGGWTFLGASISSLTMFGVEFVLNPRWLPGFLHLFAYGIQRNEKLHWGHTTLPSLLGFQENFVGTANLPFTLLLILIASLIVWRFKKIPSAQLIAFSLTASLFCAPRAFGYDLILLFPAMLLISETFNWKNFIFWLFAISIPFAFNFSTESFILTLIVFILSTYKLWKGSLASQIILT